MKSDFGVGKSHWHWPPTALLLLWTTLVFPASNPPADTATNIVIWDTGAPLGTTLDLDQRRGWKLVPNDLLTLEADPPKASSDPGYYGREYAFQGDAVVENSSLAAVFWSAQGRVVVYAKGGNPPANGSFPLVTPPDGKVMELVLPHDQKEPVRMSRCEILRQAGDEAALEVFYSGSGPEEISAVFAFDKTEIIEVRPGVRLKEIRVLSRIEYGVEPSFIGDDLLFDPAAYPSNQTLSTPSESLFLGLLPGEDKMLVLTWPKGRQQLRLELGPEQEGNRHIEALDFGDDGQSLYLACLKAPGIWHREPLKPSYLERDVAISWRRPFAAKWKTQLNEAGVPTTFAFRATKGHIWRGVPGSYDYPVWFQGKEAFFHLSKKVPPQGEALIYFLEGQNTPSSIHTPVDVLKATLGRPACEAILDLPGRKLRTHHRRGGEGVHRACTCGCTEAIQAVFEAGQEVARKKDVEGDLGDMVYFVTRHVERIGQYRGFATDLIPFLEEQEKSAPDLKPQLDNLKEVAQQILQEYDVQKENMKSLGYADDLVRRTLALTDKKDANNLDAYMELLKAWRAMGGAQDYVLAQCHALTRKLFQEAGYKLVTKPKAALLAKEIRARCRQCLRNPDGYEIWANYQ
jgi:hypothetical protein